MSEGKTAEQLYRETVEKKRTEEGVHRHYRAAFSGESGHIVLNDILKRCKHFYPAVNDVDVARQNFAKELLNVLGVYAEGTSQRVTNAYLKSRGEMV